MSELNYTVKVEAELAELAPVTYAEAVAYGVENGKSTRSVIAKVLQLNLDYIAKVVPTAKPHVATKAELVAEIAVRMGLDTIDGLDKATAASLKVLVAALG
jgi:hypothetical protein